MGIGETSAPGLRPALARTRLPVEEARHTPGLVYGSPEVLALEKSRVFMKDWLCVGRIEEVASPGDFMTHIVLGEPIVVTRDERGELNAFSNVCAHRGV